MLAWPGMVGNASGVVICHFMHLPATLALVPVPCLRRGEWPRPARGCGQVDTSRQSTQNFSRISGSARLSVLWASRSRLLVPTSQGHCALQSSGDVIGPCQSSEFHSCMCMLTALLILQSAVAICVCTFWVANGVCWSVIPTLTHAYAPPSTTLSFFFEQNPVPFVIAARMRASLGECAFVLKLVIRDHVEPTGVEPSVEPALCESVCPTVLSIHHHRLRPAPELPAW